MMKTLTIKLTAPLQSYGNEASFDRRTTSSYPTKSAIIGMIAAALGYSRTDQRILALSRLGFAVRIDQVGKNFVDFQTVQVNPKKETRSLTYRNYIQDAVFVVALSSENEEQIDKIHFALQHPKFQLYLGRRSNAPAGPLKIQEFMDEAPVDVLKNYVWQASSWYQRKQYSQTLEIIADANLLSEQRNALVKDQVVSFDPYDRHYGFRAVARTTVNTARVKPQNGNGNTQHDAMGAIEGR